MWWPEDQRPADHRLHDERDQADQQRGCAGRGGGPGGDHVPPGGGGGGEAGRLGVAGGGAGQGETQGRFIEGQLNPL